MTVFHRLRLSAATVACLLVSLAANAQDLGTEIDLTTFHEITKEPVPAWGDAPVDDVVLRLGSAPRRWYASAMIGPSFATLGTPFFDEAIGTDTIVTGGIALGIAVERSRGRLRAEVEGMARGDFDAPFIDFPTDRTVVTNNWSVMTNLWRDVMITDQVGIYVGGGIGAGGYRMGELCCGELEYLDPKAAFAWQAGGGLLWEISDRLTFDMGYRFYQMDVIEQDPFALPNRFASSELMFTLRLYEPFRRWR